MSQVTSESILTTKTIVEQAIKDYHKQILPYLNGEPSIIYSEDTEQVIGKWINGKPLYQLVNPKQVEVGVPILTEDNARLLHSAQSYSDPNYYAWKAFDGDITTYWTPGTKNGYVGWDFESKINVSQFKFGISNVNQIATQIILRYSDDGTNWTNVHTYALDTDYQRTTDIQIFDIEEDVGEHRYWSMYFSRNGDWPSFHTINFIASAYPPEWNMVRYEKALDGSDIYQFTKTTD